MRLELSPQLGSKANIVDSSNRNLAISSDNDPLRI